MSFFDSFSSITGAIIDALLPLRERSARTKERTVAEIPLSPTPHELLRAKITTLMEYREKAVEDLIQALKYDRSLHAAKLAANVLEDYLREEMVSERLFSARKTLLVPVPLHKSRARSRGFNQIELVLRQLPEEFRNGALSTLHTAVLERVRSTKPQTKLPRSERLSNVAGAFAVTDAIAVKDARIFLIDDVTTTGATLANAATPLRRAGAKVELLALARA
ncbi:MAG: ComF family protein [Candidatus Kaiserbacteria bacterium]|nr:MAG: ComF family protein [Candidatus Kaiserbacteria bacterium]